MQELFSGLVTVMGVGSIIYLAIGFVLMVRERMAEIQVKIELNDWSVLEKYWIEDQPFELLFDEIDKQTDAIKTVAVVRLMTKKQLQEEAKTLRIPYWSRMTKTELQVALGHC
jgi:hypothetical protein